MTNNINFTKASLEKLPIPAKKQTVYSDIQVPELKIRILYTGSKHFFLRCSINRQDKRIPLGEYPAVSISDARKKALELKCRIYKGEDPTKKDTISKPTLLEFYQEYKTRYSLKHNKEQSVKTDDINFQHAKPLHSKTLEEIKQRDVDNLHRQIASNSGPYSANRTLALLKSMFNKACQWEYVTFNPCKGVCMEKEKRRERFLTRDEIKQLLIEINLLESNAMRVVFKLLLFTGARKNNVLCMTWKEIDFSSGIWLIPGDKSKNSDPIPIPLTSQAKEALQSIRKTSKWVFPSKKSKTGHIVNIEKEWNLLKRRTGITDIRIHDLRRTLGSNLGQSGANQFIIQKALGHKSLQSSRHYVTIPDNVTSAYIQTMMDSVLS